MTQGSWMALLDRQWGTPIGWDEIVVGYDFGFLCPAEIQDWLRSQGTEGPLCQELAELEGDRTLRFEEKLWAACGEATGKVPRPGGRRWARAQDRWRLALLKDVLEAPLTPEALAVAVESVYERVGCPEDMLGLWKPSNRWEKTQGSADREVILQFLKRRDEDHVKA
jgi:hypothetical protein